MKTHIPRVGRNDPCPCGSGKKYKQCHEVKAGRISVGQIVAVVLVAAVVLGGLLLAFVTREERGQPSGVWSEEHGHYH